ncbi:MAG: Gfo/Idh/MocA family oxidoreductase [Cyanobacteria bacterium P01_C01_bin.73]
MVFPPVKLAVFGVGRWGVNLLRTFLALPSVEVVAVADPRPEQLTQVQQQFGLPETVTLTSDWTAALELEGLEAIAIATPAATHAEIITAALQKRLHVMVEKPLTLDYQGCLDLCQLAKQVNRQLVVDHTYLFHPAVQQGRQLLEADKLGTLRYGYAARTNLGPVRLDVDALWDLAIHDIAIFNYWLGQSPCCVTAKGQSWLQPKAHQPPHFSQGLADAVWLTLTYANGFQAQIHLCWANPDKQRKLAVVGDRGTLVFNEMTPDMPLKIQQGQFERQGPWFVPTGLAVDAIALSQAEPLKQACQHFAECTAQQAPSPISSGAVGASLVRILAALSQSLANGGAPVDLVADLA